MDAGTVQGSISVRKLFLHTSIFTMTLGKLSSTFHPRPTLPRLPPSFISSLVSLCWRSDSNSPPAMSYWVCYIYKNRSRSVCLAAYLLVSLMVFCSRIFLLVPRGYRVRFTSLVCMLSLMERRRKTYNRKSVRGGKVAGQVEVTHGYMRAHPSEGGNNSGTQPLPS